MFGVLAFALRSVLTVLVAGILVAEANGYAIDFDTFTVRKLGLLAANVTPSTAAVGLIDGELDKSNNQYAGQLAPGTYNLAVSAEGYHDWHRTVRIEAGKSTAFPLLTLFRTSPELIEERPASLEELSAPLIDPRLVVVGGEIWLVRQDGMQLVTRLSLPIEAAILLDQAHVLFVASNALRVIDIDGSNDQQLLPTLEPGVRLRAHADDQVSLIDLRGQLQRYVIR